MSSPSSLTGWSCKARIAESARDVVAATATATERPGIERKEGQVPAGSSWLSSPAGPSSSSLARRRRMTYVTCEVAAEIRHCPW